MGCEEGDILLMFCRGPKFQPPHFTARLMESLVFNKVQTIDSGLP